MKHDELADACEAWLRACYGRMTWTNMRMDIWGTGRPDVFSMKKCLHLKKCSPQVHEIKVSRGDFFADVRAEKWTKYQPFCSGVFFVTPPGLVEKSEVPKDAGLMYFAPDAPYKYNSFTLIKRPRHNRDWQFSEAFTMRLILGRWGCEPSMYRAAIAAASGETP
jgi:hypothetical protein